MRSLLLFDGDRRHSTVSKTGDLEEGVWIKHGVVEEFTKESGRVRVSVRVPD